MIGRVFGEVKLLAQVIVRCEFLIEVSVFVSRIAVNRYRSIAQSSLGASSSHCNESQTCDTLPNPTITAPTIVGLFHKIDRFFDDIAARNH